MKKSILTILFAALCVAPILAQNASGAASSPSAAAPAAASSSNILVVNLVGVFSNYQDARQALLQFQGAVELAQNELNDKLKKLNDLNDQKNKVASDLANPANSASAKADLQKQLDTMTASLTDQTTKFNSDKSQQDQYLQSRYQVLNQNFNEKVFAVVADIAKKRGAAIVINTSNPNGPVVLFASDQSMDISKEVVDTLNAGSTAPAAPAADGAKPAAGAAAAPAAKPATGTAPLALPAK